MTIYADSSFITSLYVLDAHLLEAQRRMSQRPIVWLTPLNRCELAHAIGQYVFRGTISSIDAEQVWMNFQKDCSQGVWIPIDLPASTWATCIDLARKHGPTLGIRTLDSLHVACAMELKAERFWTFDERQARLAEMVGLNTSD